MFRWFCVFLVSLLRGGGGMRDVSVSFLGRVLTGWHRSKTRCSGHPGEGTVHREGVAAPKPTHALHSHIAGRPGNVHRSVVLWRGQLKVRYLCRAFLVKSTQRLYGNPWIEFLNLRNNVVLNTGFSPGLSDWTQNITFFCFFIANGCSSPRQLTHSCE